MSQQLLFHVSAIVPVHNFHRIHTKTVVTEINETHPRYDVYSKLLQNANVNQVLFKTPNSPRCLHELDGKYYIDPQFNRDISAIYSNSNSILVITKTEDNKTEMCIKPITDSTTKTLYLQSVQLQSPAWAKTIVTGKRQQQKTR